MGSESEPKTKNGWGGRRAGAGAKKTKPPPGPRRSDVMRRELERNLASEVIKAHTEGGKELAKDVLRKAMIFAEGAVANYRPTMKKERDAGVKVNPDGDPVFFGAWFDRWLQAASMLARYESPTFRAIAVHAPEAQSNAAARAILEGEILRSDDDEMAPHTDGAERASATYLQLVRGGKA